MDSGERSRQPKVGLVLSGGGARAAYQVGVLRAISEMLPADSPVPFKIICGTSAGAINATVLAANAHNFRQGVRQLMTVWKNFRVHHVYRADPIGAFRNSGKWVLSTLIGGLGRKTPIALLDNTPLAHMLTTRLDYDGIQRSIDSGDLSAFSITCSGYTSGQSVTFFRAHRASSHGRARAASASRRKSAPSICWRLRHCRLCFRRCISTANTSATVRCARSRR